jgi:aspartate aminotransferase
MKEDGYPVECVTPQGAIYLSLKLDLIGRKVGGKPMATNEAIRQLLLQEAGFAVVPFQAFGLSEDTGWFRLSVGAVSMEEIESCFPRLRRLLDRLD